MLMYGNSTNAEFVDACIYTVSGMAERYESLKILIPPNEIGHSYDRDFDIAYMNYIFMNNNVFVEFFRIIQDLYSGRNVYLVFGENDWSENLCQSILKIIQQRYGYNGYLINTPEDYLFVASNDTSDFNKDYGLYNLDQDKYRYSYHIS